MPTPATFLVVLNSWRNSIQSNSNKELMVIEICNLNACKEALKIKTCKCHKLALRDQLERIFQRNLI